MSDDPVEFRSAAELAALPADTAEVRGVKVRDEDLAGLSRLTGLRGLYLDGCFDLGDSALEHIGRHAPLETLFLSGNGITDDGLRHLAGLTHLTELGLDAPITGEGFRHLAPLSRLETIHLPACPRLEPEELSNLGAARALATLCFYSCPRMTDDWLLALAALPALEGLRLVRCDGVTASGLAALSALRPDVAVERT